MSNWKKNNNNYKKQKLAILEQHDETIRVYEYNIDPLLWMRLKDTYNFYRFYNL